MDREREKEAKITHSEVETPLPPSKKDRLKIVLIFLE
jgi:hypothetical protein